MACYDFQEYKDISIEVQIGELPENNFRYLLRYDVNPWSPQHVDYFLSSICIRFPFLLKKYPPCIPSRGLLFYACNLKCLKSAWGTVNQTTWKKYQRPWERTWRANARRIQCTIWRLELWRRAWSCARRWGTEYPCYTVTTTAAFCRLI